MYKNQINQIKNLILSDSSLKRSTYLLNEVNDFSQNDSIVNSGISDSIDKEIKSILTIYNKLFNIYSCFKSNSNLYKYLIKNDVEYFFIRYRIILDLIEKHLEKQLNINKLLSKVEFKNNPEFQTLRNIRNLLSHEGIRLHIFNTNTDCISFQFYEPGSLNNLLYLDIIFLDNRGKEIYYLKPYLTWLIILLLNYLDEYFKELRDIRLNNTSLPKNISSQLKHFEHLMPGIKEIHFSQNELVSLNEGIYELESLVNKTIRDQD